MTDATPTSNDQTPRYQCFADGCPANHASKWQVCTLPDDDPLVRVRFLLYTQFIFGTGLTDLQAQILEAAMREIENLRKGHETKSLQSWQPVETAPTDGTEFIVFHKEAGVCACFRTGPTSPWYCMDGWNTYKNADGTERPGLTSFVAPPERWMPMPAAPSEKAPPLPGPSIDEIRDLGCCDKFVRESASEFCATCGYTNLDHLRKRARASAEKALAPLNCDCPNGSYGKKHRADCALNGTVKP